MTDRPFFAVVKEGVLHLPKVFQPLCEMQELNDARMFLQFFDRDPVTVSIILRSLSSKALLRTKRRLWRMVRRGDLPEAVRSLEAVISSTTYKSEDMTPTAPFVDPLEETPTAPGVTLNNTAAAE